MIWQPLWQVLGQAPTVAASSLAALLEAKHEQSELGDLAPYYEVFVADGQSSFLQTVYQELVSSALSGSKTNLDFGHPTVVLAGQLAGITPASPNAAPEPVTLPRAQPVPSHQEQSRPLYVPPGYETQEVPLYGKFLGLIGWAITPTILLACLGGLAYCSLPLFLDSARSGRATSLTGNRVASSLEEANDNLIAATEHLAALDAAAAKLANVAVAPWHDVENESVPLSVREWLMPPVRSASAREKQDRLILLYVSMVRARAKLESDIETLRSDIASIAPTHRSGSEFVDELDADSKIAKAKRYAHVAAALVTELAAISSEAPLLKNQ